MKHLFHSLLFLLLFQYSYSQEYLPCIDTYKYKQEWTYLGPINKPNEESFQRYGALKCVAVNPKNQNEIYIGSYTGGLFHTSDKGKTWRCLTDNFPMAILGVNDMVIDFNKKPHHILLATGHTEDWGDFSNVGLIRSMDGGATWKALFPEGHDIIIYEPIKGIQISSDSSFMIAYGRKDVLLSKDMGAHWEIIFSPTKNPNFYQDNAYEITSVYIAPNDKVFVTTRAHTIWNSDKSAVTRESDVLEIKHIKTAPSIIKLTDKFKLSYNSAPDNETDDFKIAPISSTSKQCIVQRSILNKNEQVHYYFNTDATCIDSFKAQVDDMWLESIFWFKGLVVNPINAKIQYIGGTVLYKSTDGGQTFNRMYDYGFGENGIPHADIRNFIIHKASKDGESDHLYVCTDGGLSFSSDGGKSWLNLNGLNLPITQFYGIGSSPFNGIISGGTQDNSIMTYLPKTKEWLHHVRGDGYDVEYSLNTPGLAIGQYNSNMNFFTTNDIVPFTETTHLGSSYYATNTTNLIAHANGTFYFADRHIRIWQQDIQHWRTLKLPNDNSILSFAVAPSDTNIMYYSELWDNLYKSKNGGNTFDKIPSPAMIGERGVGLTRIHSICISPYDPDKVWIAIGYLNEYHDACKPSFKILCTKDGGTTWFDYSAGLPSINLYDIKYLDGSYDALFVSTSNGVFFRESAADKWSLYGQKLPKSVIPELNINYCRGKLIAATFGRGLYEIDLPALKQTQSILINKPTVWTVNDKNKARLLTQDLVIKGKGKLTIDCKVHVAKGIKINAKNKNQLKITANGAFLNECDSPWGGVIYKK